MDILERKVAELERGEHHGSLEEFELVSTAPRAASPARAASSSSTCNLLANEIPDLPAEAFVFVAICGVESSRSAKGEGVVGQ